MPPDLLDSSNRLRQLVVALFVALAAAALTYYICDKLAEPESYPGGFDGGTQSRAYGFVYFTTALVGALAYGITMSVLNHFAKKRWERELLPQAKARERS